MKKFTVFLLVVCAAVAASSPHSKYQLAQSESGEASSEESSQEYASFGKIGFVVGLCNCVLPRGEESSEENSVSNFDCYCRRGGATLESSEESSGEESGGEESSQLVINPRANVTGQALLGCTCLFRPNSEESSEASSEASANRTFLFPTYTGREIIPIDCICKDLDDRTVNATTNPLLSQILVPLINSSSKIDFNGTQEIARDVPLSQAQDVSRLIPIWCNASAAVPPFFNGTLQNTNSSEMSFFAKCAPKLRQMQNYTILVSDPNVLVKFPTLPIQVRKWGKSIYGIDLTQISSGLSQDQKVGVLGLNATITNIQFNLNNNATQSIVAPPFVQVGPDVLNSFPVMQSPSVQTIIKRLRKRYLF